MKALMLVTLILSVFQLFTGDLEERGTRKLVKVAEAIRGGKNG